MERDREGRRTKTAAGNGLPSRRHHGTAGLRGSPDRVNRNRQGVAEESVRGEDDIENMTVDEIIGVAVPRKARSCYAKRSYELLVSTSPPSSNAPVGKNMKGTLAVPKSSSQDDFEIEIAEVLYGLRKQSQSSAPNPSLKLDDKNKQFSIPKVIKQVPLQVPAMSMELHIELVKQDNPRCLTNETGNRDGMGSNKSSVAAKEELHLCPKLDVDLQDSAMEKGNSTVMENKNHEEEMGINMRAPAMSSSLQRDSLVDLGFGPDFKAQNGNMKKGNSMEEKPAVKVQDTRMEEQNPSPDGDNVGRREPEQSCRKQQRRAEPTHSKEEKTAQPGSASLTNLVPGWANRVLPVGYMSSQSQSKALQPPHFPLSQPRTSRCTTHQYIARNIYLHQQFIVMNKLWPAPAGSASAYGATPCNLSLMLPSTPSQGCSMASHLNSTNGKGPAVKEIQGHACKDRSYEATNLTDSANRKQAVLQQTPQPAPAGSLPHGPAFFFPPSPNQAPLSTSAAQSGLSRSAISINNASSSSNSASTTPVTSTHLPAVAATMTFDYPKIAANEAPGLAMLQNNGFPLPTPFGAAPAFIGGAPQAMPFFNGSFYSPQMFHPQQPVVLPASTGSSSSHKRPRTRQLDPPPSNQSDAGGNNSGKHVEKQLSSKGGEAFTMSFTSNTNTAASNINFSSMAQNPALFPEVARQGYQVMAAAQMAHQKNHQISARKDPESTRKAGPAKTIPITGQTLVYDNSARVLNFVSPQVIGNWPWPPCSITSTATVPPIAANPPNYQQQQLLHLQKHDTMHQAPTPSNLVSSTSTKFQNSPVFFSRTPNQINPVGQSPQWKNHAGYQASRAPSTPNMASSSSGSTSKFQGKRGRTQIAFEGISVAQTTHRDDPRIASTSAKDGSSTPTLEPRQTDNSSKAAKKSSPVCRRNLPSILSTGPAHTSHIKY